MDINKNANDIIDFEIVKETIPQMIKIIKRMYDEAIEQGFTKEEAMKIVIVTLEDMTGRSKQ